MLQQTLARLWPMASRHKHRWLWGGLFLVLTHGVAMLIPLLFKEAIDGLNTGAEEQRLRIVALAMVVCALLGALFRTQSRIQIFNAARDVECDLRSAFYGHLCRLAPAFFEKHASGDLISRAANDVTQVRLMLGPGVLNVVNAIFAYAIAVPLMLALSVKLTLVSLILLPPVAWIMRGIARALYDANRIQQERLGALTAQLQEDLSGMQVVRALGAEAARQKAFVQSNDTYTSSSVRLVWLRSHMFRVATAVVGLAGLVVIAWGAFDVLDGKLSLGDLVALVEYLALLSWPTFGLGWVLSIWQRGTASMDRLWVVFDQPLQDQQEYAQVEVDGAKDASQGALEHGSHHALQISDLCVVRGERKVLDHVGCTISMGEDLGIVGPIGSGKTTLLLALLRLLDASDGHIRFFDKDVSTLSLGALRALLAYVGQRPMLFSRSIQENVAFAKPDASEAAIRAALEDACLNPDDDAFPQGLQTQVGERGITLSGGQKQRLSLARALLADAPILLLDDALASVDTETETKILANIRRRRAGQTTLWVAHRLSVVQALPQVLVLEDGKVVQRGTPKALQEDPTGYFARMLAIQRSE